MEQYIVEVLLSCNIALLVFVGLRVINQLDKVQVNIQDLTSNHGQRLTALETKAEIIKNGVVHSAG
jgi:hypothetical protein